MATLKPVYGTPAQFACTINGLAASAARQSSPVANSPTLLALDALIGGSFKTAAGTLGSNPVVNVWAFAVTDGTNYGGSNGTNVLGGGDAAFTMPANTGNLRLIASVPINAAAATEYFDPVSLASLFNGALPANWGVIVQNLTGLALDATAGGQVWYTPLNLQSV